MTQTEKHLRQILEKHLEGTLSTEQVLGIILAKAGVANPINMHGEYNRKVTYCCACGRCVRKQKFCPGCGKELNWKSLKNQTAIIELSIRRTHG